MKPLGVPRRDDQPPGIRELCLQRTRAFHHPSMSRITLETLLASCYYQGLCDAAEAMATQAARGDQ